MANSKILSYLGLSRKAGLLKIGFAASKEALEAKKAKFIAVASDVSPKSEKEITYFAKGSCPVVRISETIEELSLGIGIKAGIVAVCDDGFAEAILKTLNSADRA